MSETTKTKHQSYTHRMHLSVSKPKSNVSTEFDYPVYIKSWDDSVTGVGNPHWQYKIKRGMDATTKRTGSKSTYSSYGKFASKFNYNSDLDGTPQTDGKQSFSGFPWLPSIPSHQNLGLENVTKRASLSFLKDVRSATQQVSTGTILGELKKTVGLIKSPANSIRQLISAVMSRRYKKYRQITKRDAAKVAADTWLEIEFGIKPLFSDIRSIIEAARRIAERRQYQSVSGYAQEEYNSSVPITSYYCNSSLLAASGISSLSDKVSCRFRGSVSLETSWSGSVRESFGLLPDDFVPTLWELAPWSFIIDYFIDIGGWLNAEAAATSQVRWSCGTTRMETTEIREAKAYANSSNVTSVSGSGKSKATFVTFQRGYVSPALPILPEFRLPGIRRDFNIVALMLANRKMWPNLR